MSRRGLCFGLALQILTGIGVAQAAYRVELIAEDSSQFTDALHK